VPFSDAVELVGYHDLEDRPGFKLAMCERDDRWYLYVGHLWHSGWTVLDVTDPAEPRLTDHLEGPPNTWTLQVQAADGRLITSLEPILDEWGHDPDGPAAEEGFYIWGLDDPAHPERLGHWRTGASGTHRNFYAGGDHVHACAGFPDMSDRIYASVDISDPANPKTVGRWWWPGQNAGQGETFSDADAGRVISHHGGAYEQDGLAYCPWMGAGMAVLDVSDPANPSLVGSLPVHPPLGSWLAMHSCVPLPGTDLVVVNSEAIAERAQENVNFVAVVDVADPAAPRMISIFPAPTTPDGFPAQSFAQRPGRFGPHNQHQPQGQDCLLHTADFVFVAYFNAGLQVFDVRDPYAPQIAGHYIPDDPSRRLGPLPRELAVQCEDVLVDRRGFIYMTEKNSGVYVMRFDGLDSRGK
jgi:hypothetical protein